MISLHDQPASNLSWQCWLIGCWLIILYVKIWVIHLVTWMTGNLHTKLEYPDR